MVLVTELYFTTKSMEIRDLVFSFQNKKKIRINLNKGDGSSSSSRAGDRSSVPKEGSREDKNKDPDSGQSPGRESASSPDPSCSICLGKLDNKSFTDSCFHMFCFVCLLEWSKVKAVCPLCKQPFTSIIHNVRSIEDYDQYPLQQERETEQQRFRYRTTLTQERWADMQAAELERHRQLLQRPTARSNARMHWRRGRQAATSAYRQRIYANGMRVKEIQTASGRPARYREVAPQFFLQNPACTHRLIPWLNRELNVLLSREENHTQFVLELIVDLIKRFEINSEEFREHIQPFMGRRTDLFIHEFYSFARSPYDMVAYDRHAIYDEPDPTNHPVYTIDSDSDNGTAPANDGDDDIIMLSDTEPGPSDIAQASTSDHPYAGTEYREPPAERRNPSVPVDPTPLVGVGASGGVETAADSTSQLQVSEMGGSSMAIINRVKAFLDLLDHRDTAHSGWDSPLPGPSSVWYDQPDNQSLPSGPVFPTAVAADESASTSKSKIKRERKKRKAHPKRKKREKNGQDVGDGEGSGSEGGNSDSDDDTQSVSSEHSSDVQVVGFEKPFEDRSPILLSSGGEDNGASASRGKRKRRHHSRNHDRSHHRRSRSPKQPHTERSREWRHKRGREHDRREHHREEGHSDHHHDDHHHGDRDRSDYNYSRKPHHHDQEHEREHERRREKQRDEHGVWHHYGSYHYDYRYSGIPFSVTPIYNWPKHYSSHEQEDNPSDVGMESSRQGRRHDCHVRERETRSSSIEVLYDGPRRSSSKSKKHKKDKRRKHKHKKHKSHRHEDGKSSVSSISVSSEVMVVDTDNSASPTKSTSSTVSSTTTSVPLSSPASVTSLQTSDVGSSIPKHPDEQIGEVTTIEAPSTYKKHPTGHKKSSKGKCKTTVLDSEGHILPEASDIQTASAEDILSEVDRICAESLVSDKEVSKQSQNIDHIVQCGASEQTTNAQESSPPKADPDLRTKAPVHEVSQSTSKGSNNEYSDNDLPAVDRQSRSPVPSETVPMETSNQEEDVEISICDNDDHVTGISQSEQLRKREGITSHIVDVVRDTDSPDVMVANSAWPLPTVYSPEIIVTDDVPLLADRHSPDIIVTDGPSSPATPDNPTFIIADSPRTDHDDVIETGSYEVVPAHTRRNGPCTTKATTRDDNKLDRSAESYVDLCDVDRPGDNDVIVSLLDTADHVTDTDSDIDVESDFQPPQSTSNEQDIADDVSAEAGDKLSKVDAEAVVADVICLESRASAVTGAVLDVTESRVKPDVIITVDASVSSGDGCSSSKITAEPRDTSASMTPSNDGADHCHSNEEYRYDSNHGDVETGCQDNNGKGSHGYIEEGCQDNSSQGSHGDIETGCQDNNGQGSHGDIDEGCQDNSGQGRHSDIDEGCQDNSGQGSHCDIEQRCQGDSGQDCKDDNGQGRHGDWSSW